MVEQKTKTEEKGIVGAMAQPPAPRQFGKQDCLTAMHAAKPSEKTTSQNAGRVELEKHISRYNDVPSYDKNNSKEGKINAFLELVAKATELLGKIYFTGFFYYSEGYYIIGPNGGHTGPEANVICGIWELQPRVWFDWDGSPYLDSEKKPLARIYLPDDPHEHGSDEDGNFMPIPGKRLIERLDKYERITLLGTGVVHLPRAWWGAMRTWLLDPILVMRESDS